MKKKLKLVWLIIVLAAIAYWICGNFEVFKNVALVAIGFGAVIFIHELGHFSVGKLTGMKVEAFCLGFHPLLIGVLKTENGLRIRILPKFFPKDGQNGEDGDGTLSFTIPLKNKKAGETEYRIGMVPFGGFVKVLGQEDVGVAEAGSDPRAFNNRPVSARIAMVSAGVVFNIISAIIIFMATFMIGVGLPPAVVGDVIPGSPAEVAGFLSGDTILAIDGKGCMDFSDVILAGPLSDVNEDISYEILRESGEKVTLVAKAEMIPGAKLRGIGISNPTSLIIGKLETKKQREDLLKKTGLKADDVITAINGEEVKTHWAFSDILAKISASDTDKINISAARKIAGSEKTEKIESIIKVNYLVGLSSVEEDPTDESQLGNYYSMVPMLKIPGDAPQRGKLGSLFQMGVTKLMGNRVQAGDVIVSVAEIANPTYKDLRDMASKYQGLKLPVGVLRGDNKVMVSSTPTYNEAAKKVLMGISLSFDMDSSIVAKTIDTDGMKALAIPSGAMITKVGGVEVSSFYDISSAIKRNIGKEIEIEYHSNGKIATVMLNAEAKNFAGFAVLAGDIPFKPLRQMYKAGSVGEALGMGWKKTSDLVTTTYLTLKQLAVGLVSPTALSGPIGIVSTSYKIVSQQSIVYYLYFMALISACIAVFNFLPLPVMDGGIVVMLIIEKIKGSPISERVQGIINYVGLLLILAIFVSVTFIDIRNLFVQ